MYYNIFYHQNILYLDVAHCVIESYCARYSKYGASGELELNLNYTCRSCAHTFEIDKSTMVCPHCETEVSIRNDHSGNLQRAKDESIAKGEELEKAVSAYEKKGDTQGVYGALDNYENYVEQFYFMDFWHPFVMNVARAAALRNDGKMKERLKTHVRTYDQSFFYDLLLACPSFGSNNDWEERIHSTEGNREEFSKLCDSIIQYIAKEGDKAFAIDIFNLIKSKKWLNVGRYYIRAFLSNDDIADQVFTQEAFESDATARKFASRLQSYCEKRLNDANGITIEETKIWKNYKEACKKINFRRLVKLAATLAACLCVATAVIVYRSAVNKDTVDFQIDKIIEVTYGEKLSLDGYYVTYRKNSGEQMREPLTEKMLFGYNPDQVGTQQTVYFEFRGVKTSVTILVKSAQLNTPKLSQSGNFITWEAVPHADSYAIFVNASEVQTNETSALSYDLTMDSSFGDLTVTVRAMSASGKYVSSDMSAPIHVTKLEAPKNFSYVSGKLMWNAVEGASGYELYVNGIPYVTDVPECTLSLIRGDNLITVIAKSADKSVIYGVTRDHSLYYNQLDPITSMNYRNGSVYWQASAEAKMFRVFVDGILWKDFSRNNFSFEHDGFAQEFGSGTHRIDIVCMTSVAGVENSEMKGYHVVFGNRVSMSDGLIRWENIGVGSTYFVNVNGMDYTYGDSYFSTSDCTWQAGDNDVSIIAKLNGEEYICESFTIKKHRTPTLSANDKGWITENSGYELYSVNGGAWTDMLPDISSLAPGEYTVQVKRAVSSPNAFEIASDTAQIKISKPGVPVIRLNNGVIESSIFDANVFELVMEYFDADLEAWNVVSSVESLTRSGEYRLRAYLRAKANIGYDCCLSSGTSAEIIAVKPSAPDVIYDPVTGRLSSSVPGAKFYYTDAEGKEHEIVDGKVSNLPGGVFSVYARLNATDANMLHSENTPVQDRVSVFNLDIEFVVSTIAGSNQCYFIFKGCSEIDSISYSYEIKYLDSQNQVIGGVDKTNTLITQKKDANMPDTISSLINYRKDGELIGNYTQSDVSKIEVIVFVDGGTETLRKSYTTTVR